MPISERHRQLILDFLHGQLSEEAFASAYPVERAGGSALGLAILERALDERDPEDVELGLHLGHRFGIAPAYLPVLEALANADWHERHEDAVDALGELASPSSVAALHAAALANHEYLEYDDAHALGTKAIWALGSIGNADAIDRLRALARCDNLVLASAAAQQLDRIARQGRG